MPAKMMPPAMAARPLHRMRDWDVIAISGFLDLGDGVMWAAGVEMLGRRTSQFAASCRSGNVEGFMIWLRAVGRSRTVRSHGSFIVPHLVRAPHQIW
jgi:hypothetical protein